MSMTRPSVQAQGIHIALLDSNNNNNHGNDDNECRQQGLRCINNKARAQEHGIFISHRANATTTTIIGDNERQVLDDEASCASAQHNSHCAQAHMLRVNHRCNNQPGNVKHRQARATSSNIDNLVRKRTRLSSLVRKRASYSIKHRCSNQPFQRQA
jgi:hypothetical protein